MFENRMLRKIFGPKRDEVAVECRKLHNEQLHDLYSSPTIVRVARVGEGRGVYRVLVGKRKGKRPLGRPRHRWEDKIMMDLQEVECRGMDWIQLAQDREMWRALVNAAMNFRVP
jgi:hypothetical protein